MTDSATPLTDKALARLRSLTKGNGLTAEALELVETREKIFDLRGTLTLQAQSDLQTQQGYGRIKPKGMRVFQSFIELQNEIMALQNAFIQEGSWIDQALEELGKTKGHGWGQEAAHLSWSDKNTHLAASETCPTCRGAAQHPCPDCKGIGFLHCHTCEGRGRELCPLCYGHKMDPANPDRKCWQCEGTGYSVCRFCQGHGKIPCQTCHTKGATPCTTCNGTGFISQTVSLQQGAKLDFSLDSTSGLPSGLLRAMSRIGADKLADGHCDITMSYTPPEKKKPTDMIQITLIAKLPYADAKIKFAGKGALVSIFGKNGKLMGVPPFLDTALSSVRKELQAATQGSRTLSLVANKTRLTSEALQLVLAGKIHPNHLRKIYPVGLSAEVATEIMKNIALGLKKETAQSRLYAACGCAGLSAALFLCFFFAPPIQTAFMDLTPTTRILIYLALPLATLAASWGVLSHTAKWSLKRAYPKASIGLNQNIGKTGYVTLSLIGLLYLALCLM